MVRKIIQMYCDEEADELIRRASKETTLTIASFVRASAIREAKRVLKENKEDSN